MKKVLLAFICSVIACSCPGKPGVSFAFAASNMIEGDALVVMRAPAGMSELSSEFLASPECRDYIESALVPVNARLVTLYDAISWADGKIHFLARSETTSTESMITALRANPDVITASPNRVKRINRVKRAF